MFADSDVMFHVHAILPFCLILFSINIYQHNIFLLLNKVEVLLLRKKNIFQSLETFQVPLSSSSPACFGPSCGLFFMKNIAL